MLSRLFPRQIDNDYRGHWLAIWLLVPVVLMRAVQGANSIIATRLVMTGADGIPLDSYNAAGAQGAEALFALLGLYTLLLALLGAAVLIRWRAMIPFVYLLLLLAQLGSRAVLLLHPVAAPGGPHAFGFYFNLGLLAVLLIGFALSLRGGGSAQRG